MTGGTSAVCVCVCVCVCLFFCVCVCVCVCVCACSVALILFVFQIRAVDYRGWLEQRLDHHSSCSTRSQHHRVGCNDACRMVSTAHRYSLPSIFQIHGHNLKPLCAQDSLECLCDIIIVFCMIPIPDSMHQLLCWVLGNQSPLSISPVQGRRRNHQCVFRDARRVCWHLLRDEINYYAFRS